MADQNELQLVHAGPAYRLVVRLGLERAGEPQLGRRTWLAVSLTWGVLFLLALAQDQAIGDRVQVPFIKDFDVPAKFLVALPLLIWGEMVATRRLGPATIHFMRAGLIAEHQMPRYLAIVAQGRRLRDSRLAEFLIIGVCVAASVLAYQVNLERPGSDWRRVAGEASTISWAGWWLIIVAGPLYRFILFRWLWRFAIWALFLMRTSRLDLQLVPSHNDRAGGLGFVGRAQLVFSVVIAAGAVVLSADLAYGFLHLGVTTAELRRSVGILVVLLTLLQFLPLLPFAFPLSRAHFSGILEHSALVARHHRAFEARWFTGPPLGEAELLGMPEAGSLADLPTGFDAAQRMAFLPVDRRLVICFVAAAALPFAPLLLTQVSLAEVGRQLLNLVL